MPYSSDELLSFDATGPSGEQESLLLTRHVGRQFDNVSVFVCEYDPEYGESSSASFALTLYQVEQLRNALDYYLKTRNIKDRPPAISDEALAELDNL